MIIWDAKFEVGIETIDGQHRALITKINELERMTRSSNPTVEEARFIIQLVEFIESYAADHFRHEEECTERFRCPTHEINKEAHRSFLDDFRRFKARWMAEGYSTIILKDLHRMMSDWIQRHILGVDSQLRHFVIPTT
jgi:hemerythrin